MRGDAPFAINPALDEDWVTARFAKAGRVQIGAFLEPAGAEQLRGALIAEARWRLVIHGGAQVFEIARAAYDALADGERAAIEAAIHAAARSGFQFRYETIRVPDDEATRAKSANMIDAFARFIASDEVLGFVRRVTGKAGVVFADAQATRYVAGDFLSGHDDVVAGKNRSLAYVLGLTDGWNADWGGLLQFHGDSSSGGVGISETFVPQFNALSLFAVGQRHSVSMVAPFAGEARLAVTGWFRTSRG